MSTTLCFLGIRDLLKEENGFAGGFGIVRDYAREVRYRTGKDSKNAPSLFAASKSLVSTSY